MPHLPQRREQVGPEADNRDGADTADHYRRHGADLRRHDVLEVTSQLGGRRVAGNPEIAKTHNHTVKRYQAYSGKPALI